MVAPTVLVALDILSSLLTFVLVGFFLLTWRRSGRTHHLLMAIGFFLVAASFAAASTSQFNLAGPTAFFDALRIAGQTGGALVLAFTYLSLHRHGAARPGLVAAWALAAAAILFVTVYLLVPPFASLPAPSATFAWAHATMAVAYLLCTWYSAGAFKRGPVATNLLVPGAFLCWALTKYTWFLIDVSGAQDLVPYVYVWRFLALGLLLSALILPFRPALKVSAP